jgi:hypothetical protein
MRPGLTAKPAYTTFGQRNRPRTHARWGHVGRRRYARPPTSITPAVALNKSQQEEAAQVIHHSPIHLDSPISTGNKNPAATCLRETRHGVSGPLGQHGTHVTGGRDVAQRVPLPPWQRKAQLPADTGPEEGPPLSCIVHV